MIYKDTDDKEPILAILEKMLAFAGPDRKAPIERELQLMRAGVKSERESSGVIDFHLKDSTRTAVLHDLRLVAPDGQAAQFDHVLVQRTRRLSILDSKLFEQSLKITEGGEFLRWNEGRHACEGLASPLDRNARHAAVLRQVLETIGQGAAPVDAFVLVAPGTRIERPRRFDTSMVLTAEAFMERLNKSLEQAPLVSALGGLLKTGPSDSIGDIAKKLAALHRPSGTEIMARFRSARETQAWPADSMRST
jgi:hypothetical protein